MKQLMQITITSLKLIKKYAISQNLLIKIEPLEVKEAFLTTILSFIEAKFSNSP